MSPPYSEDITRYTRSFVILRASRLRLNSLIDLNDEMAADFLAIVACAVHDNGSSVTAVKDRQHEGIRI